MKVVAKYTLVLGASLAVALSVLALFRIEHLRGQFEQDLRRHHRTIGHVLQTGVSDVWIDADGASDRATTQTLGLIERANRPDNPTRFEWLPGTQVTAETQGVERGDYVSRFPVYAGSTHVGTIVARESLDHVDELVHAQILFSVGVVATIVVVGLIASLVLGSWLVGRPVALLVQQARRIGRRELANAPAFRRADELGELAVEMSAASQALADALEQMRHSDRLSTVGKLAAGIAHELGTPLSVVGGHAQMIAGGEVTGEAALASARAIDHEVTRMGKIVRQLLDFARRKGPEGTSCEPNEVARRCVSLLAVMAERSAVRCEVEVADPSPRALIDEDSLQQVLTNLVVNAIQAMPNGGVLRVAIARTRSAAPDSTARPAPCVRIDVGDTGGGIPADVKEHIFEPFFTTKQVGDGTGLGLAVVQGIVTDHHGWITVETGDRGTTFSVYLQEVMS